MRRDLFDQQDEIDKKRDGLIAGMERQLRQEHTVESVFCIRWVMPQVAE